MGAVSANWGKPMCLQNDGVQRPLGRSQGPWECPKAPGEVPRSLGMTQCPWECPKVPGEVSGRSPKSLERSHSPWEASYPDSVKKLSWKKAYPIKKFLEQIVYIILYHIILYHIIYYCIMLHYTTIHYIILARVCKIIMIFAWACKIHVVFLWVTQFWCRMLFAAIVSVWYSVNGVNARVHGIARIIAKKRLMKNISLNVQ